MMHLPRCLALLLIPFLVACGGGDKPADEGDKGGDGDKAPAKKIEIGAETPKALMSKVAEALESRDEAGLKACIAPDDPEISALMTSALMAADRFHQLHEKAKGKFGDKGVGTLSRAGGMMLLMHTDYAKMASDGEVEEKGDKAKVKLTQKEDGASMSQSVEVTKKNGRWVLDPGAGDDPAKVEAQKKQMQAMFGAMLPALAKLMDVAEPAVDSAKDAADFEAKIKDAAETAKSEIKAATEAMQKNMKKE